ncbi:cell wall hydrolase [Pelotomaculum propionicicum]|uniref:cell wall hydrolase n=1 Tax=Pelotomaculum propionicicum TaxID=258475 RepID=UPI003B829635
MTLVTRVFFCFFVLTGVLFLPAHALAADTHTVLPGECLYDISGSYGVAVKDLMESNGLKDYLIFPGQQLNIPGGQPDGQGKVPAGNIAGKAAYTVQPGDSLYLIAQKHGMNFQDVMTANNLVSTVIYPGMVLYLSAPYNNSGTAPQAAPQVSRGGLFNRTTSEEVDLLARLITAEADGEPYEGKVGVGAVVLNRVAAPGFPKTIRDVIYQNGNGIYQFEPVQNGWINRPASSDSIKAAKEAMEGADPTNGALYFFANYAKSKWLWSRPVSKTIGNAIFSY